MWELEIFRLGVRSSSQNLYIFFEICKNLLTKYWNSFEFVLCGQRVDISELKFLFLFFFFLRFDQSILIVT